MSGRYAAYDVLLPVGQHDTGKDETHGVERDNAHQRHWLARFRHRSVVVSKTKRMVDVALLYSPASPETAEAATTYLCWPKTLLENGEEPPRVRIYRDAPPSYRRIRS